MAFRRYAKALVTHPSATQSGWEAVRRARTPGASRVAGVSRDLVSQATEILGRRLDSDNFLLTHATIVCSVDTDPTPNIRLGKVDEGGRKINRKYADYLIKPECGKYVNNNGDAWTRPVLLKAYPTFIGAQNYLEHVQVEELSKGRIIDAVPRDVGDSLYIDILVATDRKHTELVTDIESGKMNGMSMGCFVAGTLVTMADGRRIPIECVVPGDMVLTHLGNAKEVENLQIRIGDWSMRRISVTGIQAPIETTSNHPFFVLRYPTVCACGCGTSLTKSRGSRQMLRRFARGHDKRVYNPNAAYTEQEAAERKSRLAALMAPVLEEVTADNIRPGDLLIIPAQQTHEIDSSVAAARLLGYFLAEGSYTKRKGEHTGVEFAFALGESTSYAVEVEDLFSQVFPDVSVKTCERPDKNTISVKVSGRGVACWFLQHAGEYSYAKKISPEVMGWSLDAKKNLVGAWLNGDGGVYAGRVSGVTTSFDLACQMHQLLAQAGVRSTLYSRIGTKSVPNLVALQHQPTGRTKKPWYSVVISQSEANALSQYSNKIQPLDRTICPQHVGGYLTTTVKAVEEFRYVGPVFNMEVADDHSYIVEGVAVHNCNAENTTCTKCGNVAIDETDLCDCIRYQKLNKYLGNDGKQRVIAELCGHESMDPNAGVTFIEASWVANPAFTGAVMRNILSIKDVTPSAIRQAQRILSAPPPQWMAPEGRPILARRVRSDDFGFGDGEGGDGSGDEAAKDEKPADPLQEVEDRLYKDMLDRVERRVQDSLDKKPSKKDDSAKAPNDTLIKNAALHRELRQARVAAARLYATSAREAVSKAPHIAGAVARLAALDKAVGILAPEFVYRTVIKIGSLQRYGSEEAFLSACAAHLGRVPRQSEADAMVRLGRFLTNSGSNSPKRTH